MENNKINDFEQEIINGLINYSFSKEEAEEAVYTIRENLFGDKNKPIYPVLISDEYQISRETYPAVGVVIEAYIDYLDISENNTYTYDSFQNLKEFYHNPTEKNGYIEKEGNDSFQKESILQLGLCYFGDKDLTPSGERSYEKMLYDVWRTTKAGQTSFEDYKDNPNTRFNDDYLYKAYIVNELCKEFPYKILNQTIGDSHENCFIFDLPGDKKLIATCHPSHIPTFDKENDVFANHENLASYNEPVQIQKVGENEYSISGENYSATFEVVSRIFDIKDDEDFLKKGIPVIVSPLNDTEDKKLDTEKVNDYHPTEEPNSSPTR